MLGADACLFLEVFSECRLGGEVEPVGYLLDAHCGVAEHVFRFKHHIVVDPLQRTLAAIQLHCPRHVVGREKKAVGIESHAALAQMVHIEQCQEAGGNLVPARGGG